jgi:hypothetical protein
VKCVNSWHYYCVDPCRCGGGLSFAKAIESHFQRPVEDPPPEDVDPVIAFWRSHSLFLSARARL